MRDLIRVIMVVLLGFLSSCSQQLPLIPTKPLVIVSVSPYDTFVKDIAGETVDVKVAVPANYNSHVFEPTPKQMQGFQNASLWFGIGEPFEHTLVQALKGHNKKLIQVDLSHDLPLHADSSIAIGGCASHDHHHEGMDLHFWMSPHLASLQTEVIAHSLMELFPEHRKLYQDNLFKAQKRFHELDLHLQSLLNPLHGHAIVISHPSLGYFCQDYGLIQISIECEGKTPVPGDLSKILALSKKHPVICVFTQEQFDNKGALTIAKRLSLAVYTINPNNPDYFSNMERIAQEITQDSLQ